MKKTLKVMCLTTLMVGMAFGANAQFRQSIYLNSNIPTGGFASDVNAAGSRTYVLPEHNVPLGYTEIGKEASIGFGLGYRASYRFDIGVGMVAPFVQGDFFWNMISSSLRDDYTNARAKNTPTYFNIPIFVGVSYLYDELPNDLTPYAEFGVGTDILRITPEGPCTIAGDATLKYAYRNSSSFAFMVGAGTYFRRHVSAGIYYYGLGKHTVKYTNKTYNNLDEVTKHDYDNLNVQTRTVGSVVLRIGFHF